jgi:hypothetical protein
MNISEFRQQKENPKVINDAIAILQDSAGYLYLIWKNTDAENINIFLNEFEKNIYQVVNILNVLKKHHEINVTETYNLSQLFLPILLEYLYYIYSIFFLMINKFNGGNNNFLVSEKQITEMIKTVMNITFIVEFLLPSSSDEKYMKKMKNVLQWLENIQRGDSLGKETMELLYIDSMWVPLYYSIKKKKVNVKTTLDDLVYELKIYMQLPDVEGQEFYAVVSTPTKWSLVFILSIVILFIIFVLIPRK